MPRDVVVEGSGVNMTPMIDIVFNLVTFFMLTLDLAQREFAALSLPRAHFGVVDEPEDFGADRRVTVNLALDGSATVRGVRYPLAGEDAEAQGRALGALRDALIAIARTEAGGARHPTPMTVFVRGDRDVPWRRVQWVMQACADARTRVSRIQFAVAGPQPAESAPQPR